MTSSLDQTKPFVNTPLSLPPKLIRASAGSGKTFDLSTRLIRLLLNGEKAEKILATTFTRKAAAEILNRVIVRLANAALSEKSSAELGRHAGMEELSSQQVSSCLERLADDIHLINICTLDSWFFKIAQAFPLELGVDPALSMLEEDERERLLSRSIGKMLRRRRNDCSDEEVIRFFNRGSYNNSVVSKLRGAIGSAPSVIRFLTRDAWDWIKIDPSAQKDLLEFVRSGFSEMEAPINKSKTINKHWQSRLDEIRNAIESNSLLDLDPSTGPISKFLEGNPIFSGCAFPANSEPVFEALCRLMSILMMEELHKENLSAGEIFDEVYHEFELLMSGERKIGFDELKGRLLAAALGERSDDIYYRLDRKISHLLLDEFQDTSLFEWQILEPFVDEILSKSGEDSSFFCVGDVKQAIYGWRGGCSALFNVLKKRWNQLQVEGKNLSRRSSPAVIQAVNRVFSSLVSNPALTEYPQAAAEWQADFEQHGTVNEHFEGRTEVWLAGLVDPDFSKKDQPFIAACNLIKQLHDEDPSRSIGVLARRNSVVLNILYHLSRLYPEIPASEEGGNPLTDAEPVSVILSLLKIVDHPGDTISRFHLASSPLGRLLGYTDHKDIESTNRIANKFRREAAEDGLGSLLSHLNALFIDDDSVGRRDKQRLSRLVELGYLFDRRPRGGDRIGDFISFIKKRRVADSSGVPVRVMTIHGSKGLEFDSVVLADLDQQLVRFGKNEFLVGLALDGSAPRISAYRSKKRAALHPELREFIQARADESLRSELCNLYVAMTRARHNLIMILPDKKDYRTEETKAGEKPKAARFSSLLFQALVGAVVPVDPSGSPLQLVYHSALGESVRAGEKIPVGEGTKSPTKAAMPTSFTCKPAAPRSFLHQSPSGRRQEGTDSAARHVLEPFNLAALSYGNLIHRAFESIDWTDQAKPTVEDLLSAGFETRATEKAEAWKAASVVVNLLHTPEIAALFSRSAYLKPEADSVEVFRELPFSFIEERSVISGSIDRLVVSFLKGQPVAAEVIDFKTDSISRSGQNASDIQNKYAPQISDYVSAVERLTGLNRSAISSKLVLTSTAEVVAGG